MLMYLLVREYVIALFVVVAVIAAVVQDGLRAGCERTLVPFTQRVLFSASQLAEP